ncbi:MAG: hypothetical protein ABIQ82_09765 [Variovorax sp.]
MAAILAPGFAIESIAMSALPFDAAGRFAKKKAPTGGALEEGASRAWMPLESFYWFAKFVSSAPP